MRILIAPDKFKGTLTAREVSEIIAEGFVGHECELKPVADGGEGTAKILSGSLGGETIEVKVMGPLGETVLAPIEVLFDKDGVPEIAFIEMSSASGLYLMGGEELVPWNATTYGTGELIIAARDIGVDRIILGIGGSATNDGGAGMAKALGVRFYDDVGHEIEEIPEKLADLDSIFPDIAIDLPEITVASDVNNPLLGDNGATKVFGAQKGIRKGDIELHESRLKRFADVVEKELQISLRNDHGAGAAGGLGFGLMAFCDAKLEPGFELVANMTDLEASIRDCDLVITGEGSIDIQSLMGKAPNGVAKMAKKYGKPVIAFCGVAETHEEIDKTFDRVFSLVDSNVSIQVAMEEPAKVLKNKVDSCRLMIEQLLL